MDIKEDPPVPYWPPLEAVPDKTDRSCAKSESLSIIPLFQEEESPPMMLDMSGKLEVRDIKDPPMDIMSPPPPSDIILLELISLKRAEWSPELPREVTRVPNCARGGERVLPDMVDRTGSVRPEIELMVPSEPRADPGG